MPGLFSVCLLTIFAVPLLVSCQSNLPPPTTTGVFTAQASSLIDAPIEEVWAALLNFPAYPNWNPFARSMTIVNTLGQPLANQTPQVNRLVRINAQIPPLKPPVNAQTPSNPLHSQTSYENITTIDYAKYRAAWKAVMLPNMLLDAERWSALSVVQTPNGSRTLYESREIFGRVVSRVVGMTMSGSVQQGFEAQALALRQLMEG